jgi:hypothetical protein
MKPIRPLKKSTIGTNLLKKKPIARVGETGNFIIDYDSSASLILMYGKEAPTLHGFKLGLDKDEATAIIHYLKKAKTLFPQ